MINFSYKIFSAAEPEPEGLAALGIDGQAFVVQLITFLLVFAVLYKFVFVRVVDLLEKRRKTIEEGVQLTTEMKAEREKLEQEIAKAHKQAREEADQLLAATKDQSDGIIRQAEEKASVKVETMLTEAKKKITDETQKARRNLEKDIVDLVVAATEQVSREKLDDAKDRALVSSVIKEQA